MMKRPRKVGVYKNAKPHIHYGLNKFLEHDIDPGVHSFQVNGQMIDLLYDERNSSSLIVFFSAAVTAKITYPYFSGIGIAHRTGDSLLAFSDPAICTNKNLATNWTLGDSSYPYHRDLPRIIQKMRRDRRLIFVGASAGGYPSLYYGSMFPDSVSFVINPRTALFTPPTHLTYSSKYLFPGLSPEEISEVIPTTLGPAENTVLYFQNRSDDRYYANHALPFFSRNVGKGNVFWKLGEWGEGHMPPDSKEIAETIISLTSAPDWEQGAYSAGARQLVTIDDVKKEHDRRKK